MLRQQNNTSLNRLHEDRGSVFSCGNISSLDNKSSPVSIVRAFVLGRIL